MRIVTPAELGLDAIDLKSLDVTTSPLNVDALGQFQFMVVMKKTLAAGTATTGLGAIGINVYRDEAKTDILFSQTLVTLIDNKISTAAIGGSNEILTFGGSGAEVFGTGTLQTGVGAIRVVPFMELFFNVTEVVDVVATAVGEMYLLMEGFNR